MAEFHVVEAFSTSENGALLGLPSLPISSCFSWVLILGWVPPKQIPLDLKWGKDP
jgi:hypothetical protein